jgi:hypothetical protein
MKKFTVLALLCAFALGSCQAISFPTNPAPNVDSQGTVNALIQTANAQTLTAQPSPTTVPPTSTFTPVLAEASPTATLPVVTDTPVLDLTAALATASAVTATSGATPTGLVATFTPTAVVGQATASPTLGIRTYGTLPPLNRPFTQATIFNRSKAEAYISLQIETDQGYTIIEYPVVKMVRIKIPTGNYTYVVWVGGRQFVGFFHASQIDEPVITIFKDKIVIK